MNQGLGNRPARLGSGPDKRAVLYLLFLYLMLFMVLRVLGYVRCWRGVVRDVEKGARVERGVWDYCCLLRNPPSLRSTFFSPMSYTG